ncbi:MAG: DNA polymerase domain-containing protein [Candidatus Woesearchaeota archaeon]
MMVIMKEFLIDVFREKNHIVLWKKKGLNNSLQKRRFVASFYTDQNKESEYALKRLGLPYYKCAMNDFMGRKKKVFHAFIENIDCYEEYIRRFESITNYKMQLYNADISPEEEFMLKNNIFPFTNTNDNNEYFIEEDPELTNTVIELVSSGDIQSSFNNQIKKIILDDRVISGDEKEVLTTFKDEFTRIDPDIIIIERAYLYFPYIMHRFKENNILFEPNRIGEYNHEYKEGRAWHSYGLVIYKDRPIRLKGRLLIDTNTAIGRSSDISGIIELCRMSGARFQNIVSRSFGFVFQQKIIRTLYQNNMLVPYKEKPVDTPMKVSEYIKSDRYGHRMDPKPGFYNNIIEIDFASMYPWIIYYYNISADTLLSNKSPLRRVPGLSIMISDYNMGIIPLSIKPFLDKRMEYKKNPTTINNKRSEALKAVLVSSYGYLRFREFKLGLGVAHMTIGAYSRELLLDTKEIAEEQGYKAINGVVDSLYLQYKEYSEQKIRGLLSEATKRTMIPLELKSVYEWMIILPSIADNRRRVSTRYYGLKKTGEYKIRGLMLRSKGHPPYARMIQQSLIESMKGIRKRNDIQEHFPKLTRILREAIKKLYTIKHEKLVYTRIIGREEYAKNTSIRQALNDYRKRGIKLYPGQKIRYIITNKGAVMPTEKNLIIDYEHYKKILIKSLYEIMQPFNITIKDIIAMTQDDKQTRLEDYYTGYRKQKLLPEVHALKIHSINRN